MGFMFDDISVRVVKSATDLIFYNALAKAVEHRFFASTRRSPKRR